MRKPPAIHAAAATIAILATVLAVPAASSARGDAGLDVDGRDGRQWMEDWEDSKPDDQYARMTVRLVGRSGGERVRVIDRWVKEYGPGESRVLIKVIAPKSERDAGVLTIENPEGDDDQWIYLPRRRRIRRVAAAETHERFIGSDFTFEDLRAEKLDQHVYEVIGTEEIDGRDCVLVDAQPADEETADASLYGRRVFALDREWLFPREIRYFDKDGEFLKVQRNMDWNRYHDVWRPDYVEMENEQEETMTVLEFAAWHCNEGLDDRRFTKRALEGKL